MLKGLYKRGSIWWLRYAGLDGKIIFESSGSKKQKEAEALLHQRKTEVKGGKQPESKKIGKFTFRQLAEEYKQWAERQKSYSSKIYHINKLLERFGSLPLRSFSTMIIEQYQTELLKEYKPASTNRIIACLQHMFTKAVDWEMVEEEFSKRVHKAKLLEENNQRLRFLNKDECDNLINASPNHLKPIIITALNTGMRKNEILGLQWNQVDLEHGFILLDETKNGERREIPINKTLRGTLNSLFKGTTKKPRRIDVPYVFYDYITGKRYQDIKTAFHAACKKAIIANFRFHDLRHTFASQMIMLGIDLVTVKELLGHKDIKMTLRYAHLAPSHKRKAVDMLGSKLETTRKQELTVQQ